MTETLFDIYMTNLFTTLGQLSAVVLSTTVAVPVYNYYANQYPRLFKTYRDKV